MSEDEQMAANLDDGCKLCSGSLPDSHLVYDGAHFIVRHSQETNILGYCLIQSKRHFLDLSEAEPAELSEFAFLLSKITKIQKTILLCPRVYTFSLAEAVPHFHMHVIPRSSDFPRAYKGRGIMSYPLEPSCDQNLLRNLVDLFRIYLRRELFPESAADRGF